MTKPIPMTRREKYYRARADNPDLDYADLHAEDGSSPYSAILYVEKNGFRLDLGETPISEMRVVIRDWDDKQQI